MATSRFDPAMYRRVLQELGLWKGMMWGDGSSPHGPFHSMEEVQQWAAERGYHIAGFLSATSSDFEGEGTARLGLGSIFSDPNFVRIFGKGNEDAEHAFTLGTLLGTMATLEMLEEEGAFDEEPDDGAQYLEMMGMEDVTVMQLVEERARNARERADLDLRMSELVQRNLALEARAREAEEALEREQTAYEAELTDEREQRRVAEFNASNTQTKLVNAHGVVVNLQFALEDVISNITRAQKANRKLSPRTILGIVRGALRESREGMEEEV